MILIDANLFLYASLRELPQHPQARDWLEEVLSGDQLVGLPWMVVLAVLRISTNVQTIEPGPGHWAILRMLLAQAGTAANLTNDAHLAALAIGNAAVLTPPTTISSATGVCGIAIRCAEHPLPTHEVPVATAIQAHR